MPAGEYPGSGWMTWGLSLEPIVPQTRSRRLFSGGCGPISSSLMRSGGCLELMAASGGHDQTQRVDGQKSRRQGFVGPG